MPISIKFPFRETQSGGVFMTNELTVEAVQTNLISLLTMKRRHRPMRPTLYSPLWDYIFEPWDEMSSTSLKSELIQKISEFLPQVQVKDIEFNFVDENNLLEVKVIYTISDLGGVQDEVNIVLPVEPGT